MWLFGSLRNPIGSRSEFADALTWRFQEENKYERVREREWETIARAYFRQPVPVKVVSRGISTGKESWLQ